MKKTGIIVLLFILCSCMIFAPSLGAKPHESVDVAPFEPVVRAYFNDQYLVPEDTDYAIVYDIKDAAYLEKNAPGAILVQAYGKFDMPHVTGTFIFWKKRAYVMPDEFNSFIKDANVKVSSEDDALLLADLYVKAWEPSGTYGVAAATVVTSADDIPQRNNKVPPETAKKIKPQKAAKKPDGFIVTLQSWSQTGGYLRDWELMIDSAGVITDKNSLIGEYIGDCFVEGARAEKHTPKEMAASKNDLSADNNQAILNALGDGEHTQDVVIGGTKRFVIHWRDEDFDSTADGTSAQVVSWVDTALRNAWQQLIVTGGFTIPSDGMIDVYIWNDTAAGSWGPVSHSGGEGAMWHMRGSEQYIYPINKLVAWFGNPGFNTYWPTAQDAHQAVDGHEFFHAVQEGYQVLGCGDWVDEGSARFIQTYLAQNAEFWQNSNLAGMAGGPFLQDDLHRSHYIKDSTFYVRGADVAIKGWSYKACTYWRHIYEHRGGIATIRSIFQGIDASPTGGSFDAEIARINAVLGTTEMGFTDFASANYQEFSPFAFARDNDFYQFSDRYYADVNRVTIAITSASSFPVIRAGSVVNYSTMYFDIDPGNVRRLRISFNGNNADTFSVKAFKGHGSTVDEVAIPLDGNKDGSVTIPGADTLDIVGLMIAHIDSSGTGSYTFQLEKINTPPVAEANGPYSAPEGTAIELDASGSSDADTDPLQYRWDINGDGTWEIPWTSDAKVSHTWCDNIVQTVTLEVTDGDATSSDTGTITVTNAPPVVDAGANQSVDEGDSVHFSGTASDPGSCDTLTYSWDFGDSSPAVTGTLTPTHIYCDNADYKVTLTVIDDDGGSTSDTLTVKVENKPPVVDAGPNQNRDEGDTVQFGGTASDPGSCDVLSYSWDFGDSSPVVTGTLNPTHAYGDNGEYTVTLTVTDDDGGSTSDTLTVKTDNVAPTVTQGAMDQPNPQFILPLQTLTFHGTFSDPGWLDTHTANWEFGDGSSSGILTEENLPPDATGTVTATHAYSAPGNYSVHVTVTDDDGGATSSASWTIHIADVVEAKHDLADYIQNLPPSAFKGNENQRKNAFASMFSALDDMIGDEEWNGFITSLQNNIRGKADGQIDGKPGDDWIKEYDAQYHICMKIDDIVAYVKTLS